MAKHQRLQDAALGVRPAASALAAAAKAAADRTPFRFMLTGVHVTDDAVRSVVGVDKDTWYANEPLADVEDEAAADAEVEGDVKPCSVLLFGRREDGPSVCVRVKDYRPWLHAELPADWSDTAIAKFVAALNGRLRISDEDVAAGGGVAVEVDHYKRYYGWVPDEAKPWKTKRFRYAKLSFPNLAAFGKARSALTRCYLAWAAGRLTFVNLPKDETLLVDLEGKTYGDAQAALKAKALDDAMRERLLGVWLKKKGGLQLPLADTLQKPAARFLNDLGLSPSEWMTVAGFSPTAAPDADTRISNCDVEVVAPATPRNLMPAYDDVTHESPNGVDVYTASRPLEQAGRALSLAGLAERDRAYEAHPLIASATVYAAIQRYAGTGATGCPKKHSAPLAKIAPLVLASFDGEMYAAGDAFPSVVKGDSTKYIGTNFRVGAGPIVRVMQCVGRVAKPAYASAQPGDGGYDANVTLHVECYDSERELFEAWRDLIVSLDPDLLISWNGFGFDFPFMAADYEQCFAGVDERATEGMQQALRAKARELLLARGRPVREETAFLTAPNLLVRFRAVAGWAAASAVVEAARKAHGGKVVKDLLASEKLVAATHAVLYSNNVLTMLGVTADEIEAGAGKEDGKGMTGMKGVDKDKLTAVLLAAGAGALPAVTEEEDEDGEEEKEEEEEEGEEGSDVDEQEDDQGEGESEDEDADPTAPVFAAVDDLEATVAVQLSPLPEMAAAELRDTLRLKLMEAAATACGKRALSRYAREARAMGPSEDITALSVLLAQLEEAGAAPEFYAWVASQRCLGPGVVRLLTMPVPPADAVRRGQYLSRLAAERCPLFEKRMASAAKGDNVYNYYAMTGRTPVDLMQVIKDDKKPEDNSLRYAAEKWLGAAKKPDDKATAATAKEKEKAKTSDGSAGTKRKREDGGGEGGGGRDGKRAKTEAPATATTATTAAAASTVASAPATATATSASAVASTVASASVSATATAASASATATEKGKDKDIGTGDASKAKIDLSAVEMFRRHRQGERDPTRRWLICEYCAKDCEIPLLLVETLKYVTIWVEMSRVCFTPLEQVVNAGQQVKVFNLIARFVHGEFAINVRDSGWPVNDYNDEEEVEGGADTRSRRSDYQGATVIEPKKGFYTLPISTLDFASLYPSIIRFFNLCPSVLVIDDEYKAWDTNPACRHRVTLERHTIAHNVLVGWRKGPGGKREPMYKEEERTYTFATHIQGVLPRLLKHLGACRKAAKAVMEAAEGKAALCKATASFLHGIALSGAKDATEAAQELEALRAGGKPKAGQLRTFQMGLTAGSCDAAGFARARTMLAGAAADLRSKLARESDEDAAKKLTGALAELEAFGAAVDGVEADHTRSVEATDGSGSPKTVAEVLAAAVAGFKANAAIHDMDASVQNGRQLGIKVSMNSVYGFNGVAADKGLLPCKPVAAVTTLKGRAFIEVAKDYAERTYPGCQVVYGDTDSIMIMWGRDISVEEAFRLGGEAAKAITALLRSGTVDGLGGAGYEARVKAEQSAAGGAGAGAGAEDKDNSPARDLDEAREAVKLENEKVFWPYLLDNKKRYAGVKWTPNEETGEFKSEQDMKGIDAVRRDRPKYVRETVKLVLKALLYDRSVAKAREVLVGILDDIVMERLPQLSFVMSRSVRGAYKGGVENLPQVQAWRRMAARGDEGIPPIGGRMPYLITAPTDGNDGGAKSDSKLYTRAEHPAYVTATGAQLDLRYYVESLHNPVTKLVSHVGMAGVSSLFAAAADRADARMKKLRPLTDYAEAGASAGAGAADDDDDGFLIGGTFGGDDMATAMMRAHPVAVKKVVSKPAPVKAKAKPTKTTNAAKAPQRNLLSWC